jgi:hypothetical protein
MMPPNNQRSQPELAYGKLYDDAARHRLDFDFISRNPDYKHLVAMIDTGDHNWLDMGDENKIDLFARGAAAAAEFLQAFNWTNTNLFGKVLPMPSLQVMPIMGLLSVTATGSSR